MSLFSTGGLARASSRHPWRVIGLWIVVLIVGGFFASTIGDYTTTEASFLNNPESVQGTDLIEERFGKTDEIGETVVVRSETFTVDQPEFQQVVADTTSAIRGLGEIVDQTATFNYYEAKQSSDPDTVSMAEGLVSKDRHTTLIAVTFNADLDAATEQTDEFLTAAHKFEGNGFEIYPVGDISINHEFSEISEQDLVKGESIGIMAALIILIVVFGALVAAGLPILLAVFSIGIATGLAAIVGRAFELSFFVTNMITMIGLAVGIDYALFIVERYREERRHGREKLAAIEIAGSTASKAVLFSGITVVLALFGLFLIPTTIFRSLGLGAVLVVIMAVAIVLTFIPALLALLGDRIDWPRRRNYDASTVARQRRFDEETLHGGFWGRVTRIVMGHPAIALVLASGMLVLAAIPYFDLNTGFAGAETLPKGDVRTGYQILAGEFAVGRLAPVEIVIDGDQTAVQPGIDNLTATLASIPALSQVEPTVWDDAGDLAVVRINLTTGANDRASIDIIEQLRNEIVPLSFVGTPADVYVTGDTAFNKDFFDLVDKWTPIVFAFVLGLSFLLLMVVFRSIVVPAKAILMNLLSVGASYGLLVLVFQKGAGAGLFGFQETPTIEAWIPIFLFCVLFGLSMDYHVFLISRIQEHYDQTNRNAESVAVGLQATAKIITGAALIMVAVFAGFASGRLVMFQQMGFGLGVAVLLDATIVRSILVPSAMALLGDRNWYMPKWLHWLPDLRIEGAPIPHMVAPAASPAD